MKRTLTAAVAGTLLIASMPTVAQVYTCTVGDRKVYQSKPCQAGDKPVELYVPPAPKYVPQHRSNDHVQEYLQRGRMEQQRGESIVDQRAREARNSRLQREQAEAEKQRIDRAVMNDQVIVGMTPKNVRDAWGEPDDIDTDSSAGGTVQHWFYRNRDGGHDYVAIRNGKVSYVSQN
jgi:hypothetical protein